VRRDVQAERRQEACARRHAWHHRQSVVADLGCVVEADTAKRIVVHEEVSMARSTTVMLRASS